MNIQQFSQNPIALAVALALSNTPSVYATPGDYASDVFQVHRSEEDYIRDPDVAMSAAGNAVIVWERENQNGEGLGIFGQRYRPGGIRVGPEFQVNSTTAGVQRNPVVTMDPGGNFVVAFDSTEDGTIRILARRFDRYGNPLGDDFQVNTENADLGARPAIDSDAFGNFIIAWEIIIFDPLQYGIAIKRFSHDGKPIALDDHSKRSEYKIEDAYCTDIAMDADGDFVVGWIGKNYRTYVGEAVYSGLIAYVRVFDQKTTPITDPIRLFSDYEPYRNDRHQPSFVHQDLFPKVGMDADGDFVVVVRSGFYSHIPKVVMFDKSGDRKLDIDNFVDASSDSLDGSDTDYQISVAMDEDGDFVVIADTQGCDNYCDSSGSVSLFDQSGELIKQLTDRISSSDPVEFAVGSVAMDADGDMIAVWQNPPTTLFNGTYAFGKNIEARLLRGFEKIDLKLKQNDRTDPVPPGGVIDYRLHVKNRHPKLHPTGYKNIDRAIGVASGVRLTDWIPKDAVLLSAKGDGWRCRIDGKHPQCNLNHGLWPGEHAMLNLKVRAPKSGDKAINHARVHADQDDPNPENNRARERTFLTPH